jgi:hypothetical protein
MPETYRHSPEGASVEADGCIGQRGIERPVTAAALPDHAALIQNPDERTRLVAVADFNGAKLSDPSPQVGVRGQQP